MGASGSCSPSPCFAAWRLCYPTLGPPRRPRDGSPASRNKSYWPTSTACATDSTRPWRLLDDDVEPPVGPTGAGAQLEGVGATRERRRAPRRPSIVSDNRRHRLPRPGVDGRPGPARCKRSDDEGGTFSCPGLGCACWSVRWPAPPSTRSACGFAEAPDEVGAVTLALRRFRLEGIGPAGARFDPLQVDLLSGGAATRSGRALPRERWRQECPAPTFVRRSAARPPPDAGGRQARRLRPHGGHGSRRARVGPPRRLPPRHRAGSRVARVVSARAPLRTSSPSGTPSARWAGALIPSTPSPPTEDGRRRTRTGPSVSG